MKKILVTLPIAMVLTLLSTASVGAVDVFEDVCNKQPDASTCKDKNETGGQNPIYGKDGFLTQIINLLTIVVGIAAVVAIILAGMKFITSGSNPQEVTAAREMILYAVVALVVVAMAQIIVRFFLTKIAT